MIRASTLKFLFVRYFMLVIGIIHLIIGWMMIQSEIRTAKSIFIATIFFISCGLSLFLFGVINDKIHWVAISKTKLVVFRNSKRYTYRWSDVKSLRSVGILNIYRLKIRGKRQPVYFLPSHNIYKLYLGNIPVGKFKLQRKVRR